MGLAKGIIPEAFWDKSKKEEVIRVLINSPIPNDLKQIALKEWANEVQTDITELDRKRVGL